MDLRTVKHTLEQKGFQVQLFETVQQANEYLCSQIQGATVGFGGSVTLKEMGLFQLLGSQNQVWWHNDPGQVCEYGQTTLREKAANTDIYLSSVNAMSAQGHLINIDGTGNRIASTVYGHKKVYYVLGVNKIEDSLEKAIWRARNISAPKNAQRLHANTPCAAKGDQCYDCKSPGRICRSLMITEYPMLGQETQIILINASLGY